MSLALPTIFQHWAVATLGIVAAAIYYMDTFEEKSMAIEKFGDPYREYMLRVPRINFLFGIFHFLKATLNGRAAD